MFTKRSVFQSSFFIIASWISCLEASVKLGAVLNSGNEGPTNNLITIQPAPSKAGSFKVLGRVAGLANGDYRLGIMETDSTGEQNIFNPDKTNPCDQKPAIGDLSYVLKVKNTDLQNIEFEWNPSGDIITNDKYAIIGRTLFLAQAGTDCKKGYFSKGPAISGIIGYMNASDTLTLKGSSYDYNSGVAVASLTSFSPVTLPEAKGIVTISSKEDGKSIGIKVELTGLSPNKKYAIHIHQFGDISGEKLAYTGSHFNPKNTGHGCINGTSSSARHAGDLGTVLSDANGNFTMEWNNNLASLNPTSDVSIIGRSVVLHEGEDTCQADYKPGTKVLAGVIGWRKLTSVKQAGSNAFKVIPHVSLAILPFLFMGF